jgi:hypothetical protein
MVPVGGDDSIRFTYGHFCGRRLPQSNIADLLFFLLLLQRRAPQRKMFLHSRHYTCHVAYNLA